jgi:nucleotide-binding universal stress UspA family protein
MITTLMALALAFSAVTQVLRLEAVLGAFIAGILVGQVKRFDERLRHIFEQVALGVFAPVFFAAAGLRVDLGKLARPSVAGVGLLVLALAIIGKFVGAYLGARASRQGHWEALSLGAGMNARGAMEIIVATIGFTRGILSAEMYSIILMVAVVTSLMAPPILRWALSHVQPSEDEQRRLEGEERRRESFVGNLKRVLVPVPSDDGRTTMAAKLVRLLVEEEDVEVTSLALRRGGDADGAYKRAKTAVHEEVGDARSIARADGGDPSRTILAEAERGYDLLVLGATTRGTDGDGPLFEDFVDDVIQQSPCPLLVVSARKDDDPAARLEELCRTRILVPTSGTDTDRYAAEVAFAMAAQGEAEVDLVHVVSRPQHELRMGTHEAVDQAVKIGEDILAKTGALGEALGVSVNTDVIVANHPEEAIVERAGRGVALVVMASGRKATTHRAFFGHRIDYVISHSECPVAVVAAASGNGSKN